MKYYEKFKAYYDTFELDNGLKVYHVLKPSFTTKAISLVVNCGSKDNMVMLDNKEYNIKSGIFHCLEHKIYELPNGADALDLFSSEGVDANAFTTYDKTEYVFKTTEDIIKPLKITFDFLFTPVFNQKSLNKEKKIILSERRQTRDSLIYLLESRLLKELYPDSGLSNSIIGSVKDIKSYTCEDLKFIYDLFYRPSNMSLVLVGDYNKEEVNLFLKEYFKDKKFLDKKIELISNYNKEIRNKNIIIKNDNVSVPKVMIGLRMKYENSFILEALAYEALMYIFLEESSEVYQELLHSNLITDEAYYYLNYNEEYGFLYFVSDTNDYKALKTNLHRLFNSIPTSNLEESLERFKKYAIGDILPTSNNPLYLCEEISDSVLLNYNYFDILDIINCISVSDILNTIKKIEESEKIIITLKNK